MRSSPPLVSAGWAVYRIGNQLMTVSYSVNGNTFVADKPRSWIAALGGADWDLSPVAVVMPEGVAQPLQPEHEIVMLQNFVEEVRRKVPPTK